MEIGIILLGVTVILGTVLGLALYVRFVLSK